MRLELKLGLGSGRGGVSEWTPDSIAGLAAWIDAHTAPESIDASNGIKTIRCKKTNNQLVAPDIVAETSTLRPVYDAANKKIVFTAANSQMLSAASFFTDEPFKSATKGMGQAWTFIWVGSTKPVFTLHSAAGANYNLYASGKATNGGVFGIYNISAKTIYAIIKPAASNPLWMFDTINTTAPFELSGNSPVPTVYLNDVKQSNGTSASFQPTSDGAILASGGLSIGNWGTIYYNTTMNEMLMYDRAIAESDLLLLIAHLKTKWKIA